MINLMRRESFERAKKVKLIISDVDGVLTDGGVYIGETGELFKPFHARDGLGINIAMRLGFKFAIITGRKSQQLMIRAKELGISDVFQGQLDKRAAYNDIKEKFLLTDEDIAYIGDDLNDVALLENAGLSACPVNACETVKNIPGIIHLEHSGGNGAVREFCEYILNRL